LWTVTGTVDVNQPPVLALTSAAVTTAITVMVEKPVTIVATGGTAPYSYTFNGTTNTTGVLQTYLQELDYHSFTDAKSCGPVTGTVDVNQPPVLALTSAAVTTAISCNGGKATVTIVATGELHIQLYISNTTNTTGFFTDVPAGTGLSYSFTDAKSCGPVTGTVDVNQPQYWP
jgi:hypothetical protein